MLRAVSAVVAFVAASATLRSKVAANPAQPAWPKEFTATIQQIDVYRNHTDTFNQAYSFSNQAVQNVYTDKGFDFESFYDYKTHRRYDVFNGTQCRAAPDNSQIWVPPIATFTFNGTATINGVSAYKWLGQIAHAGDLEYFSTANTAQNPVAFLDHTVGFETYFQSFTAVTTWPANQFTPPSSCGQA